MAAEVEPGIIASTSVRFVPEGPFPATPTRILSLPFTGRPGIGEARIVPALWETLLVATVETEDPGAWASVSAAQLNLWASAFANPQARGLVASAGTSIKVWSGPVSAADLCVVAVVRLPPSGRLTLQATMGESASTAPYTMSIALFDLRVPVELWGTGSQVVNALGAAPIRRRF